MPRSTNKYSLAQIREINNIFSNDDVYTQIYNAFYNNAGRDIRKNVGILRTKIISLTSDPTAFKGPNAQIVQSELENLLTSYKDGATTTKSIGKFERKVHANLVESSINLLKIVDGLTKKVFNFSDPQKYAKKLVNDADNKTQTKFNELQAYSAITRKLLAQENGEHYEFSNEEETQITNILGKNALKKEYTLAETYPKLEQTYTDISNIDFVKSTAKTNYLKRSGIHAKQILKALAITGIAATVLGSSVMGAAPVDASFLSSLKFFATQMLPWAGAAIATVGGYNAISRISSRRRAEKVRQQIRTQIANKGLFFELLNKTRPTTISREDNLIAAIERKQNKKINLNNTHFTRKSLAKLLKRTRMKMFFSFTEKSKENTLRQFKNKLYSHGIRGELPSDNELRGILSETYSRKAKNMSIDDAIKNLQTELKKHQTELLAPGVANLNLDLGSWKPNMRENYLHLLNAHDKIEQSSKLLGAPLFATRRKQHLDRKRSNLEANYTKEVINIPELSPKNPACELLSITGTKTTAPRKRTTTTKKTTTIPIPTPIVQQTPAFARQESPVVTESITTNANDLEKYQEIAGKIANANLRKDTAIYRFEESNAEFTISINKATALDCNKQTMEILNEIKNILPTMAKSAIPGQPSEYTFEQNDSSVDITITLNENKKVK